jgi:hypothetical protein
VTGRPDDQDWSNLEGYREYDIRWPWSLRTLTPGLTAVLRTKNEAENLRWVLPPLFEACSAVLVVDNGSEDGTPELAVEVAAGVGRSDALEVLSYPFSVSRCGSEHLSTPARSVHSLAYFYNWAFAQARTTYVLKWDGDMVLTPDGVAMVQGLGWQLESAGATVTIPRHPVFVESEHVAYVDLGLTNVELYGTPNRRGFPYVKAFEWEMRMLPESVEWLRLPEGLCIEIKRLDADEFSNWTSVESFASGARTERKQRELAIVRALRAGQWESIERLHRVEAPRGVHVIDHLARTWLPTAPRPLLPPEDLQPRRDPGRTRLAASERSDQSKPSFSR